jgi:hypothetical protein
VTLSTGDRLDILELLARADNAATRRDAHTYVALFAEDGVLDGEKGEHRGRRALFDAVGPVWASEGSSSVHLTLNAVIDTLPGETQGATASSTLMIADPLVHRPTYRRQSMIPVELVVAGQRRSP